jgi:hypothetical protein
MMGALLNTAVVPEARLLRSECSRSQNPNHLACQVAGKVPVLHEHFAIHNRIFVAPGLLRPAARVFSRKGLKRSLISEIADQAGVAPGTLYHYGESKEALLCYVLVRGTGGGDDVIPESLPIPAPGRKSTN